MWLPLALLVAVAACSMEDGHSDDWHSLVAAERAFARMSVEQDQKSAFLANLAEEAILFNPRPVDGRALYLERGESPAILSWQPEFAHVSLAGDMGYTFGPWQYRAAAGEEEPVAYGHFATVWVRQSRGAWKAAIDIGIGYPEPPPGTGEDSVGDPAARLGPREAGNNRYRSESSLMATDRAFSGSSVTNGLSRAFEKYAAGDLVLFRAGGWPLVDTESIREALSGDSAIMSWRVIGGSASRSGDIGFTYGIIDRREESGAVRSAASYLRVWRKDSAGEWRVALDAVNLIPVAAAEE